MNENNMNNGYPENNQPVTENTQPQPPIENVQQTYSDEQRYSESAVNGEQQNMTSYSVPQENPQYIDVQSSSAVPKSNGNQMPPYSSPYASPYQMPQYDSTAETQPINVPVYSENNIDNKPAKSKKGKKIALIACALALTLCVGIGGGFLGSYLSGNMNGSSVIANTSETSKSSNSENSSSGLTIIQASDTETKPTTTQEVAEKVQDAVVEITTEITQYDSFYGQYVANSAGSGVIISADGYIITNNHVIEDATSVQVRLTNGETYDAKLVGTDETLDVALIKIDAKDLTVATFGDSSKLSVGQTAIAIGNPLGQLGGTVTDGIISALDREIEIDNKTMNLLQTSAAINPGNSGGGLFDSNGNLIGIVVAKSTSTSDGTSLEGLGFAIPVNDIVDILDDLKTSGYVTGRASLGVTLIDISNSDSMFMYRVDRAGTYVSQLTSGGAAEKAGIQVGDCIIKLNDTEVSTSTELKAALSDYKAGDKVNITVYRDGKEQTLEVTLDESVPSNIIGSNSNNTFSDNNLNDSFYGNYYN